MKQPPSQAAVWSGPTVASGSPARAAFSASAATECSPGTSRGVVREDVVFRRAAAKEEPRSVAARDARAPAVERDAIPPGGRLPPFCLDAGMLAACATSLGCGWARSISWRIWRAMRHPQWRGGLGIVGDCRLERATVPRAFGGGGRSRIRAVSISASRSCSELAGVGVLGDRGLQAAEGDRHADTADEVDVGARQQLLHAATALVGALADRRACEHGEVAGGVDHERPVSQQVVDEGLEERPLASGCGRLAVRARPAAGRGRAPRGVAERCQTS